MASFRKAERKSAKLRAAICGTSGSGKTYSALLLAKGLGDRIAVIDTERGSSELYSDLLNYDVAQLSPPYTPSRYIALIKEAEKNYDVLIIDSLSHAWSGEGGVLEMHDNATRSERSGNSYTAWRNVTPAHNALVEAILSADCHVICSMRSKTAYDLVEDGKGGKKPVKIGLAPIQRDGMEYEFTLVIDVSVSGHVATASKDRTRLWDGRNETIKKEHGEELRKWLESGIADASIEPPVFDWEAAEQRIKAFSDVTEMRIWLAQERHRMGWNAGDPEYKTLTAVCSERAEQIKKAAEVSTKNEVKV